MIYFIGNREIKMVKIGLTINLQKRLTIMRMYSPVKLEIIATVNGEKDIEEILHKHFEKYWSHGEWFNLTKEIERFIKKFNDLKATTDEVYTYLMSKFVKREYDIKDNRLKNKYPANGKNCPACEKYNVFNDYCISRKKDGGCQYRTQTRYKRPYKKRQLIATDLTGKKIYEFEETIGE